jgi:hypothetical protein
MSRGPGRIERAIRQLFDKRPDEAFTTDQLCVLCYNLTYLREVKRHHRVAVVRAGKHVVDLDPDWDIWFTRTPGRPLIWHNAASERSVAMAKVLRVFAQGSPIEVQEWTQDVLDGNEVGALLAPDGWVSHRVAKHLEKRQDDTRDKAKATRLVCAARAIGNTYKEKVELVRKHEEVAKLIRILGAYQGMAADLAERIRWLMQVNDPDMVRKGLGEIADALEASSEPPEKKEAA